MGVKEYEHLRKTMLNVAELTTTRKKARNRITRLKKGCNTLETNRNNETVELNSLVLKFSESGQAIVEKQKAPLEKEIKDLGRQLWRHENVDKYFLISCSLGLAITFLMVMYMEQPEVIAEFMWLFGIVQFSLCCFIPFFWILGSWQLHNDAPERARMVVLKKQLKTTIGDPSELISQRKKIAYTDSNLEKATEEITSLKKQIKEIDFHVKALMNSVAHLTPYAEQLD